jgi:hypothetical protein
MYSEMMNIRPEYNLANIFNMNEINNTNTTDDPLIRDGQYLSLVLKSKKMTSHATGFEYTVCNYDKKMLTSDHNFHFCRSVIINNQNKIVCVAPPKSLPHEAFLKMSQYDRNEYIIEEYLDGTMVNVFWNEVDGVGHWELATKNVVGATCSFYKNADSMSNGARNFREMFIDILAHQYNAKLCPREPIVLPNKETDPLGQHYIDHLFNIILDKTKCYSFVMQHVDNRIVRPILVSRLYIVGVYSIQDGIVNVVDVLNEMLEMHKRQFDKFDVYIMPFNGPYIYQGFNKNQDLDEFINRMSSTHYSVKGIVFKHKTTGLWSKIRNTNYEHVKQLRGNHPKMQYLYLTLRLTKRVSEYLFFFPEHAKMFEAFRGQVHDYTRKLYKNYVSCYIEKKAPLLTYPANYRNNMYRLHQIYLNTLKLMNPKENMSIYHVMEYVNALPATILMASINYPLKQQSMQDVVDVVEMNE